MKNRLFLYLLAASMLFSITSCLDSDDNLDVELSPYATLRSVSINDIVTDVVIKGTDGKDSIVKQTAAGNLYPFVIDQQKNIAYNVDSLPVGTDVTRVSTKISCDGVAYIYVDSLQKYEILVKSDSLDYTEPVKLLITSTDGTYAREYKIMLNVHKVDPDRLNWNSFDANPAALCDAVRLVGKDDLLYLFGVAADGSVTLSTAAVSNASQWQQIAVIGLPSSVNLNSLTLFGGRFHAVADGKLYISADGINWNEQVCDGVNFTTLFAASDKDNILWAVANDSVAYANDAASGFKSVQPLGAKFPLYDISSVVSPLRTNMNINRYILVGRASNGAQAQPQVWGKLSTERKWSAYIPSSYNSSLCPALERLAVIPYDSKLYAFGGQGVVQGAQIEAFSHIYVSRDNGLTWSVPYVNAPTLPSALEGTDAPFAAYADNFGSIWIVVSGADGSVWRGRMNKFDIE